MGCRVREVKCVAVSAILALLVVSTVVYTVESPDASRPHPSQDASQDAKYVNEEIQVRETEEIYTSTPEASRPKPPTTANTLLSAPDKISTKLNPRTHKEKSEAKIDAAVVDPSQKREQPISSPSPGNPTAPSTDTNKDKPRIEANPVQMEVKSDVKRHATVAESPQKEEKLALTTSTDKAVTAQPVNKTVNRNLARYFYSPGHLVSVPERCPSLGAQVKLLVMVTSALNRASRRMAIRQTWGSIGQRTDVAMMFIVGVTTIQEVSSAISHEQETFGDIVQGNFTDTYRNLTLKSLSTLEWFVTYCPLAKFMLKVDDDVFVNTPNLLDLLNSQTHSNRSLFGKKIYSSIPFRDKNHKWYVPINEFAGSVFPDYLSGSGYLMTGDVIKEIYDTALDTPFLSMEDVFLTGVVAESLKIERKNIKKFFQHAIQYPLVFCDFKCYFLVYDVRDFEEYYLWTKIFNGRFNCKC